MELVVECFGKEKIEKLGVIVLEYWGELRGSWIQLERRGKIREGGEGEA